VTGRVLAALIAGLALGAAAGALDHAALRAVARVIEPVGTLWTNAIRMTVVPLVAALVVTGVAEQSGLGALRKLGGLAVAVFVVLLLAGGFFAVLVTPLSLGRLSISPDLAGALRASVAGTTPPGAGEMPSLVQRLLDTVPVNPIRAAADGAMLPLVVFTLIFAAALTRLDPAAREPVIRLFRAVGDTMLVVVRWVLALAPIGIFGLAVGLGVRMGIGAAGALLAYVLTLSAVLLVFTLLLYPMAGAFGRASIRQFAAAAAPAQAVAFSSRSSLAALPAMIAGARERLAATPAISGFVLPFAVSVFRVNVPIAWVVGAVFLGRLYDIPLGLPALLGLVVTSTLISFSVPGIPSASLFLLAPVLVDLGLPGEGAGILIAVDAIPDMFKTTANVTAHLTAATILGRAETPPNGPP
jgi:Na+/H+-dicarboxylate symporter